MVKKKTKKTRKPVKSSTWRSGKKGKPVLELKNVSKIYTMGEYKVAALDDVCIEILEGDFVAVIGPSGSGKSTLLHLMGALDRPTKGKILLDGKDIGKLDDAQLAKVRGKKIGFVFQFFQLVPSLTAQENVALPMWFQDVSYGDSIEKAKTLLESVGLAHRFDHLPNQMSGGEQQRVAIARALANDPSIILADEPTGNLDTESGAGVIETLKKLHKLGKTVIIVTHDTAVAGIPDKHISLMDGRVIGGYCPV